MIDLILFALELFAQMLGSGMSVLFFMCLWYGNDNLSFMPESRAKLLFIVGAIIGGVLKVRRDI